MAPSGSGTGHMAEVMDMRKRKETMKNMYSSGKRTQEVI